MNKKNHTIDVLNTSLKMVSNLSSNIAGGALLTNTLYTQKDRNNQATVLFLYSITSHFEQLLALFFLKPLF